MTLLRKEDTAKAAKLVGAIVVVFGLAAWRVASAIAPARPADPAPEAIGTSSGTASTPAAATSPTNGAPLAASPAGKPDDTLIQPSRPVLGSMIDPFRTIAPLRVAPPSSRVAARPAPLPPGPLPPALPETPSANPVAPAPPLEEASLRVTGILAGANATAVVERGKEICVVREGGQLPDGTEVVAIGPTTVTLRKGGKTHILDVGN